MTARPDNSHTMSTSDVKVLSPPLPPGRADRKALGYTSEIQRLRALGYTFEAIRLALADAGIHVGLTTVKREAARPATPLRAPTWPSKPMQVSGSPPMPTPPSPANSPIASSAYRSGKQIAEEFIQSHVTNPLVRAKMESAGNADETH